MNKFLLSKYYVPNVLSYFSLLGNIIYLFAFLIVRTKALNFCRNDFSCNLMQYTSLSFKYYFCFCVLLSILILGLLTELILRKLQIIKSKLQVNKNLLKKMIYIFSFVLIPISFVYLIFLFWIIYAIFDTINNM